MSSSAEPEFLEHACDATRILAKRRQLFDLKERYAEEKKKYDEKMKILDAKEADLSRREVEFEDKLMKFEKYTKESELKEQELAIIRGEEKICDDLDNAAMLEATSSNGCRKSMRIETSSSKFSRKG